MVHGLGAQPSMMEPLAKAVRARGARAHVVQANACLGTFDGVAQGGDRVAEEVRNRETSSGDVHSTLPMTNACIEY